MSRTFRKNLRFRFFAKRFRAFIFPEIPEFRTQAPALRWIFRAHRAM